MYPDPAVRMLYSDGGARRASRLQRVRVEAGKAPRCCSSLGASSGSEDLEKSDLAKGFTDQSKDMGPTGRHVASLNKNVIEHVRLTSFAVGVSCTNKDWQQRSHRTEKKQGKIEDRMGRHIGQENLPWSKMMNHAKLNRES